MLSLDLVTGYCGVATLGHAALFGAGAYAAGIASAHYGINDPLAMLAFGIVAGAVAGLVCGVVILRAHGLPQLVLSIALIHLFHEFANKASSWTGGSDGLSGIAPTALLGLYEFDLWGRTAYVFGVALLAIVFVLLRLIVRSPFGMLCRGIKEDPIRIRSMGASPKIALMKMYVISGAVAGVGGALNAITTQVVGLDSLSFTMSAESLVMLVLGGTGSLFGALTGRSSSCSSRTSCRRQTLSLADDGRGAVDRRRAVRTEGHLRYRRQFRYPPPGGEVMQPIFEVRNLKRAFGGLAVTNDVSLSMAPGDRVALIGPNGAGKTTFVNLVTGNLRPDSGEVRIGGEAVTGVDAIGRVRRGSFARSR